MSPGINRTIRDREAVLVSCYQFFEDIQAEMFVTQDIEYVFTTARTWSVVYLGKWMHKWNHKHAFVPYHTFRKTAEIDHVGVVLLMPVCCRSPSILSRPNNVCTLARNDMIDLFPFLHCLEWFPVPAFYVNKIYSTQKSIPTSILYTSTGHTVHMIVQHSNFAWHFRIN